MKLEVKDISVSYGQKKVLDRLSFSVEEGQWLMIAGPNGAGKSTTVNAITGGVRYTGEILLDGENIRHIKPQKFARSVGVLAQSHSVTYSFSVEEVVALGRYSYSSGFLSEHEGEQESREKIERALELTGLAQRRHQSVLTLSGGELQRTFLAQVLAQDPRLLLLDEPANHLDLIYLKQIFMLLRQWLQTPGRAIVSVMHDLSLAKAYGTNVLLMDGGKAVAFGTPEEVLTPAYLEQAYGMDVYAWMREMFSQWKEPEKCV